MGRSSHVGASAKLGRIEPICAGYLPQIEEKGRGDDSTKPVKAEMENPQIDLRRPTIHPESGAAEAQWLSPAAAGSEFHGCPPDPGCGYCAVASKRSIAASICEIFAPMRFASMPSA